MDDPSDYERCEYDPETRAARFQGSGCRNHATHVVGARGQWHLCSACAQLPAFKRFVKRFRGAVKKNAPRR